MLAAFLSAVLATGLEQSEPSDAGDLGLQLRSPLRDRAPHREDRAGPAAGVEQSRPPSDAFTPRVAVYIYPFSTAEMFIAGQMSSPPGGGNVLALYGAGGASVRLSDKVGLDVEVGGGMLARQTLGWVFSAGVGPSLQLTGDEHFRGLFIATRFRFQVFQPAQLVPLSVDSNEGPADLGPGLARAFRRAFHAQADPPRRQYKARNCAQDVRRPCAHRCGRSAHFVALRQNSAARSRAACGVS